MSKFRKAEAPEELFGSPLWEKLNKKQKAELQDLVNESGTSPASKVLIEILSRDGEDLLILWYRFDPESGAFSGVFLPEGFDPETMPEELSEELFEHFDLLERTRQETIEFHSHTAAEEAFWQEVGLTEEFCLCWMRAEVMEGELLATEGAAAKGDLFATVDAADKEPAAEHPGSVCLMKADPEDPWFLEALTASFEEGNGLYLRQLESLKAENDLPDACLIRKEGRIIGEALLCRTGDGFMLSYFGIVPKERGKGNGTAALKQILQEYHPLILSVEEESDAFRLYERNGFVPYRYDITFVVDR